jgi:hypothetical protein
MNIKVIQNRELSARVWRAAREAAGSEKVTAALHQFLPDCTFAVKDDVPTARIVKSHFDIRIEFGSQFLAEELKDDRDFLFVLLHEIYHHVLGHLRTSKKDDVTPVNQWLSNIVADMMVNRAVCERFFPDGVPILDRMYGRNSFPCTLLLPPPNFGAASTSEESKKQCITDFLDRLMADAATPETAAAIWRIYKLAWFNDAPYDTVLERLVELYENLGLVSVVDVLLLGNHDDEATAWIPGEEDRKLEETTIKCEKFEREQRVANVLRRALCASASQGGLGNPVVGPGVVCMPGRRDTVMIAAGITPVIYQAAPIAFEPELRAHVYVDVSNSLIAFLPAMYGILNSLRDLIADPVHQFSTVIADVTMAELARGVRRSTGGTKFNPIFRHAIDHDCKDIVVFTDGEGRLTESLGAKFKDQNRRLHLVKVNALKLHREFSPLPPIATTIVEL